MCTHAHPAGCVRTSTQTNLLNSDQGSVSYKNQLYNEQCPVTKNSSGKMTLINEWPWGVHWACTVHWLQVGHTPWPSGLPSGV